MRKLAKSVAAAFLILACQVPAAAPTDPVDLLAEAKWEYSTDAGKTYAAGPVVVPAEATLTFLARTSFKLESAPTDLAGLELRSNLPGRSLADYTLNGEALKGPMPEMVYKTLPAIDPKLLRAGDNTLAASIKILNPSAGGHKSVEIKVAPDAKLLALKPEHLVIQSGPILGAADEETFTVTCRTNLPATISISSDRLRIAPVVSDGKLFHRLRVPRSFGASTLTATIGDSRVSTQLAAPEWKTDNFDFVILGDSRTNPGDWQQVSTAAAARKPQFVVVSGDLVAAGKDDISWDREFFTPGKQLLSTTPTYAVIGNHEQNAPLYDEMFPTPGQGNRQRNWHQQIGPLLMIGIDGAQDWSEGSKNAKWLENILAGAASAKYIFLTSHYPAWSSSSHGKVDEKGLPREKPMLQMRQTVAPLLEKYKATAMFAGHDHTYERSEAAGVTYIVSGGAGAPRYAKAKDAEKQNPNSKVYNQSLHYCLLSVTSEKCLMRVYTPQGEEIDQREWPAR